MAIGLGLAVLVALAIGLVAAVWVARLRARSERTNEHLLAQNALAVTLVEPGSLAEVTPKALAN